MTSKKLPSQPVINHKETLINGEKIKYFEAGSKHREVIILIHSWPSSSRIYYSVIKDLAASYHVYAPDLPGFGLSDEPSSGYTYTTFVDFIKDFLKDQDIPAAHVCGVSLGAAVALKFAHDYPDMVNKLILNSPPVSLYSKHRRIFKLLLKTINRFPGFALSLVGTLKRRNIFSLFYLIKAQPDSISYTDLQSIYKYAKQSKDTAIISTLQEILSQDLHNCAPRIKSPTLLLVGQNEYKELAKDMDYLAKSIPDSRQVFVLGGDHHMLIHKHQYFSQNIIHFLSRSEKTLNKLQTW